MTSKDVTVVAILGEATNGLLHVELTASIPDQEKVLQALAGCFEGLATGAGAGSVTAQLERKDQGQTPVLHIEVTSPDSCASLSIRVRLCPVCLADEAMVTTGAWYAFDQHGQLRDGG